MTFAKWLLYPIVKHWIAGEKLADAIKVTKEFNKRNIKTIINFIGENVTNRKIADKIFKEYSKIINSIKSNHLNSDITIKLTQFCLYPDSKYCHSVLVKMLKLAKKAKVFVWFDMENSKYTKITIRLYLHLLQHYRRLGISIQSYLKGSEKDLKIIVAHKGIVRLVKGAYRENPKIVYTKRSTDKNFVKLMKILFLKSKKFAIGTHDDKLIDKAIQLNEKYKRDVEFETLYGIRESLIKQLANEGHKAGIYLPYGTEWLAYGLRRIRERKRNILLLFRSLIGQ